MSIHPDNDTRAIAAERDRLKALNAELLAALEAARLTYEALDRNREPIMVALSKMGLPTSWLGQEIMKAGRVRAAIAKATPGSVTTPAQQADAIEWAKKSAELDAEMAKATT